jgi:glycosyltransferase involved in cell wall biosynthesis
MKIKLVHIINSLEYGGAEIMLASLLERTDRDRFEPVVVALIDEMTLADRIESLGIPIRVIGMRPGVPDPRGIVRLARLLRRERPDVVQTWMDHANLIGGLALALSSRAPLVWGVHHANHDTPHAKRTTLWTVAACARLSSRLPSRIVFCSESARRQYALRGFAREPMTVIPNGFDLDLFRPDFQARVEVRRELGLGADATLIGLVARFDPLKDHATFLRAAALMARGHPDLHFLLCGSGVDANNPALTATIDALGLREKCHLLGPRRDVARIQASLDLATSSSISEAFPLVIGEAMASGVPCVATDVGDSAIMIGATGRIVAPGDPRALADACREVLDLAPECRRRLGREARRRIEENYNIHSITNQYLALYEDLRRDGRDAESAPHAAESEFVAEKREATIPRGCIPRETERLT